MCCPPAAASSGSGREPEEAYEPGGLSWLWERVAEVEKDQATAEALFRELMAYADPHEALNEPRFHSPTVAGFLIVAGDRESSPPVRASFAALALEIAERVDLQRFPEFLVIDLKVRAGCALAEAERLRFDQEGARRALERVAAEVENLPLDTAERGLYCHELAIYRKARGQTEEALALFGRAACLFEELDWPQELGQARLEEGWLRLEDGEAETAESAFLEALGLLDPEQSPRKALRAHFGLAFCLAEQGRTQEALDQVREARRLRNLLPCSLARKQARVWEAEVARRCGRSRRAVKTLRAVLEELLAEGSCYEAVPVALSLLDLFARTGKPQDLGRFCRDFDPAVRFRKLPERSRLLLSVAFGVTRAGEREAPRVRACAGQILQILPYHPDLPLPRDSAGLLTLPWDEMPRDFRLESCRRVFLDERLAEKSSREIEPETAEVLAWAVELVAGVRILFFAESPRT